MSLFNDSNNSNNNNITNSNYNIILLFKYILYKVIHPIISQENV